MLPPQSVVSLAHVNMYSCIHCILGEYNLRFKNLSTHVICFLLEYVVVHIKYVELIFLERIDIFYCIRITLTPSHRNICLFIHAPYFPWLNNSLFGFEFKSQNICLLMNILTHLLRRGRRLIEFKSIFNQSKSILLIAKVR